MIEKINDLFCKLVVPFFSATIYVTMIYVTMIDLYSDNKDSVLADIIFLLITIRFIGKFLEKSKTTIIIDRNFISQLIKHLEKYDRKNNK
jgi:hypothetical protein